SLLDLAQKERAARPPLQVRCCVAAGCVSANSPAVLQRLREAVDEARLQDQVRVAGVGCLRLCCQGPLVQTDPDGTLYQKVTPENAPSILDALRGGQATAERGDAASPFFALQASVVLANCGQVEPERIETYLAAEGYQALHHALRELKPAEVIDL